MAPAKEAIAKVAGRLERRLWVRAELILVVLVEGMRSREEQVLMPLDCRQPQAGTLHGWLGL